jgi:hypothetical protein
MLCFAFLFFVPVFSAVFYYLQREDKQASAENSKRLLAEADTKGAKAPSF